MSERLHPKLDFSDTSPKSLDCPLKLGTHIAIHEANSQRCECGSVTFEVFGVERCVALEYVNNNRPPCDDVALLCLLIKLNIGVDNVGA